MFRVKIKLVAVALLAASSVLNAAEPERSRVDQLQAAKDNVARAANETKGGPRHLLLQEERRLDQLIDDLEHGRAVDAVDIDRALQRAQQGGF